jgi:hypothetical protein
MALTSDSGSRCALVGVNKLSCKDSLSVLSSRTLVLTIVDLDGLEQTVCSEAGERALLHMHARALSKARAYNVDKIEKHDNVCPVLALTICILLDAA